MPFLGQIYGFLLFFNNKIQIVRYQVHLFVVVLHVEIFRFLQQLFDTLFTQVFDQRVVFGKSLESLQEHFPPVFLVPLGDQFPCLGKVLLNQRSLCLVQLFHNWPEFVKLLVFPPWNRARDDQWRSCIVNQNRVNLVHDGIMMLALYEILGIYGHIIPQVIKAEFIVCSKGNVGAVSFFSFFRIGLVLVNTIYFQAVKFIKRPHPFRVTF